MAALLGFFETWNTLLLRRATACGIALHAFPGCFTVTLPAADTPACGNALWFILKTFIKIP